MWESWHAGAPTDSDRCSTFADGLAVRVAIPLAVAELNPLVQQFELVSEAELEDAMRAYLRWETELPGEIARDGQAGFRLAAGGPAIGADFDQVCRAGAGPSPQPSPRKRREGAAGAVSGTVRAEKTVICFS